MLFDVLLSGPGASGSRPMPNGQQQEPGGWNRVVLKVADLAGSSLNRRWDFISATRWKSVQVAAKSK
jgi:hypothetical protein